MKRIKAAIASALSAAVIITALPVGVSARFGDMGFNGGITEGVRLPKTTEQILSTTKKPTPTILQYKEVSGLSGVPTVIEGLIRTTGNNPPASNIIAYGGIIPASSGSGSGSNSKTAASSGNYTVAQTISPPRSIGNGQGNGGAENTIARNLTFNVNWRRVGSQLIEDYSARSWSETVSVGGATYNVDPDLSHYDVSVLSHQAAGATYYKADISASVAYMNGEEKTVVDIYGSAYGYECAWSAAEVYRLDVTVNNPLWQMNYQVRPAVSVNKELQYSKNEPTAISFEGNYREVMGNISGVSFDVFTQPARFLGTPKSGSASLSAYNTFEQLPAVDAAYLKGHPAESDIKKLFSMGVLKGDTKFYQPAQAITRGEFVTMIVNAIKAPVDLSSQTAKKTSKTAAQPIVFPDVPPERPDYPYIMAAYKAGIANGRGLGNFNPDEPLEREEAVYMLVQALGLSNLGLDPTPQTRLVDDAQMSAWAKQAAYAALRLDLIREDENGKFYPRQKVSKAEGAALLNRMLDYMREGIALDYTEHIVNYAE